MPRRLVILLVALGAALAATACKDDRPDVQVRTPPGHSPPAPVPGAPADTAPPPPATTAGSNPPTRQTAPLGTSPAAENPTFLRVVEPPAPIVPAGARDDDAFRRLVEARLEAEPALYVDAWWATPAIDGDRTVRVARLCADAEDDAWHRNWFLVQTSNGAVHVLPFTAQSRAVCAGATPGRGLDRDLETRPAGSPPLVLFDADLYGKLAIRHIGEDANGALVELRSVGSEGAGAQGMIVRETLYDWALERFWLIERLHEPGATAVPGPSERTLKPALLPPAGAVRGGLLLTVGRELPADAGALDPDRHLVVPDGEASLRVAASATTVQRNATARPETTLTLRLSTTDDASVPATAATLEALRAADHLELWWCATAACSTTGDAAGLRAIAIGLDGAGAVHAAWLVPEGSSEAVPEVTRAEGSGEGLVVEVALPLSQLAPEQAPAMVPAGTTVYPLTAVFNDADPGEESMRLATSRLEAGREAASLGRLIALPELSPLPRVGRPLAERERIVSPADVGAEPE